MDQDLTEVEQPPSAEEDQALFDYLADLPPVTLGRNDPCHCASGKKYKKCCLDKDTSSSAVSKVQPEPFEITAEPMNSEESKSHYPDLPQEEEEVLADLYYLLQENPEEVYSENCSYFQILELMRIQYPKNPIILNYITSGYQHLGLEDKAKTLIFETYEKFPDYLFAQIAVAHAYLDDKFPEKALETIKGAYSLKTLYPHRNVFHVSEVSAFENLMVRYFCMKQNIGQAETHLAFMKEVLEEDNDLLQLAKQMIRYAKGMTNSQVRLSRLLNN
jgi:hypothetical protein